MTEKETTMLTFPHPYLTRKVGAPQSSVPARFIENQDDYEDCHGR